MGGIPRPWKNKSRHQIPGVNQHRCGKPLVSSSANYLQRVGSPHLCQFTGGHLKIPSRIYHYIYVYIHTFSPTSPLHPPSYCRFVPIIYHHDYNRDLYNCDSHYKHSHHGKDDHQSYSTYAQYSGFRQSGFAEDYFLFFHVGNPLLGESTGNSFYCFCGPLSKSMITFPRYFRVLI